MEFIHTENQDNNLVIINLGKFLDDIIFNTQLDKSIYKQYIDKAILNNYKTEDILEYSYHDKIYNITKNKFSKLVNKKIIKDNNKLICICKREDIKKIEFESKKNYNIKNYNYIIVSINENIDIYFNEDISSITIYINFNAYIKDSIDIIRDFIDNIDN